MNYSNRVFEGTCHFCRQPVSHVNDGGSGWAAYMDVPYYFDEKRRMVNVLVSVTFMYHTACSDRIEQCCDLDVLRGSHCPECSNVVLAPHQRTEERNG